MQHAMKVAFLVACLVTSPLVTTSARAQSEMELKKNLLGPWVMSSTDDARWATLTVRGVSDKDDGYTLDAVLGGRTSVEAKLLQSDGERKLLINLPTGIKVSAKLISDAVFEGTSTDASGVAKNARLVNISAKPSANVPAQCAAFHGGWGGDWRMVGQTRLWILGIDSNCNTYYQYNDGSSNQMPMTYQKGTIRDGSMLVKCGTGGTCVFTAKGEEIWATYTSTSGNNNAVFRRLPN